MIRNSLDYVGWKDRKAVAAELKTIYRATTEAEAAAALVAFSLSPLGLKYPPIAPIWRRHWQEVSLLCLPAGGTQNHLYHQRHRELEYAGTQGIQEPWPLP